MKAYTGRVGLVLSSVRFNFDGHRIGDKDTPSILGMKQGDIIDAMVEQTGGVKRGRCVFSKNEYEPTTKRQKLV